MSPIDHLVVLLRQRLNERVQTTGRTRGVQRQSTSSPSVVAALLALEDTDDHQLRRAFIQDVLAERLGRQLLNEAKFQQVVERVTETLERDAEGSLLLSSVDLPPN